MFKIDKQGQIAIVSPQRDLREFEFGEMEEEGVVLLGMLEHREVCSVVVDFQETDYYGSTALSFFVKVWTKVRANGGRMAFCNVSPHEREILEMTKLDTLWSLSATREEAIREVSS